MARAFIQGLNGYYYVTCNKCKAIVEFHENEVGHDGMIESSADLLDGLSTITEYVYCPNCNNKIIVKG